jgi:hypothetical protein
VQVLGVEGEKADANGNTNGSLHPSKGVPYVATFYSKTKDLIIPISTSYTMLAATKGNVITYYFQMRCLNVRLQIRGFTIYVACNSQHSHSCLKF